MKENKDIIKRKSYKNYIKIFLLLIFVILSIFIDKILISEKFMNQAKQENKLINNLGNLDHSTQKNIYSALSNSSDNQEPEKNPEETKETEIIKNYNIDIEKYRIFISNLLYMMNNIYSDHDSSKEINYLKIIFVENKSPDSIEKSLEFLDQYNKEFIINKENEGNIVFPNTNNPIWKLLYPIIKIEKINSEKNNSEKALLQKNIESIIEYSCSAEFMQRFIKND